MTITKTNIENLKQKIIVATQHPDFRHHKWFVKYHLELVEKISRSLCGKYPEANLNFVLALGWLHDYGKIIGLPGQDEHMITRSSGPVFLTGLGFEESVARDLIEAVKIIDGKNYEELVAARIEIKIVSTADGASHLFGPFYELWFYENPKVEFEMLMAKAREKLQLDWHNKIVLPEVKELLKERFLVILQQNRYDVIRDIETIFPVEASDDREN